MDSISMFLIVAATASLTASVSGLLAARSRSRQSLLETEETGESAPTRLSAPPSAPAPYPAREAARTQELVTIPPPTRGTPAPKSEPGIRPAIPVPTPPPTVALSHAPTPSETARIIVLKGAEPREWIVDKQKMVIGRSPEAECSIPSLTVSRKHASIERKGTQFVLTDFGSRNGVYVRGVRITEPVVLRNHDTLEMGEITLEIVIG